MERRVHSFTLYSLENEITLLYVSYFFTVHNSHVGKPLRNNGEMHHDRQADHDYL